MAYKFQTAHQFDTPGLVGYDYYFYNEVTCDEGAGIRVRFDEPKEALPGTRWMQCNNQPFNGIEERGILYAQAPLPPQGQPETPYYQRYGLNKLEIAPPAKIVPPY